MSLDHLHCLPGTAKLDDIDDEYWGRQKTRSCFALQQEVEFEGDLSADVALAQAPEAPARQPPLKATRDTNMSWVEADAPPEWQ